MKITDKDCVEFKELKKYVKDGNIDAIDDWFNINNISKNPSIEDKLVLRILNETYFFSYSSPCFNIKELKKEELKREIAILKNFNLKNQLLLFGVTSIENLTEDHINVLKVNKKNINILEKSPRFNMAITKLFHNENFSEIEKIEKTLNLNVLEIKTNYVFFNYTENNNSLYKNKSDIISSVKSRGMFSLKIDSEIFQPKIDVLFSVSEEKIEYLKNRSISLPTDGEIFNIYSKMISSIDEDKERNTFDYKEKINNALKEYSYLLLSMNIPKKEIIQTKTKAKI